MSGFEHVVSHLLDLQAEQRGEPLAMHGSQVGLASILGLAAYRSLIDDFDPRGIPLASMFPEESPARARVLQAFHQVDPSGRAGEECWSDYRIKLEAWHAQRERVAEVVGDWQAVRAELDAQLRPPARPREILRAVAAPLTFAELHPPARSEAVRFAFENAPFMRRRLTVADLLVFFHLDRVRVWERAWGEPGARTV
jgi:glycerol-1-phosphate dehydrogenase [NAD(P)+]